MAVFPLLVPGRRRDSRPCDGSAQCQGPGLPVHCLISSIVAGVEVRPLLGDLGRALLSQALLVLRGHLGVACWLSYEGLTKFEGGLGHELVPPGAILRHGAIR